MRHVTTKIVRNYCRSIADYLGNIQTSMKLIKTRFCSSKIGPLRSLISLHQNTKRSRSMASSRSYQRLITVRGKRIEPNNWTKFSQHSSGWRQSKTGNIQISHLHISTTAYFICCLSNEAGLCHCSADCLQDRTYIFLKIRVALELSRHPISTASSILQNPSLQRKATNLTTNAAMPGCRISGYHQRYNMQEPKWLPVSEHTATKLSHIQTTRKTFTHTHTLARTNEQPDVKPSII